MRVIIAGNRNFLNQALVDAVMKQLIESEWNITEIVCGMAPGADELGYNWALRNRIQIKEFPAEWLKYQGQAGPIRNIQMAEYAGKDGLLVLFDFGNGKGSGSMRKEANKRGIKIYEVKDRLGELNNQ